MSRGNGKSYQLRHIFLAVLAFSLYTLVQSVYGIRRSLEHFRDAFLFTVAQILMWCLLSELHFHTPLGAGVPGQGPGECGRRIAGHYACPTQEGGHPPQRGASAVPWPSAPIEPAK